MTRVREVSVKHVYVMKKTHTHKIFLEAKQNPLALQTKIPMPKDDTCCINMRT